MDRRENLKNRKKMTELTLTINHSNRAYRLAVGGLFFMQGLCFATWASRIPSIQQSLNLSDAALGIALFALPVGSMIALPLSSWLIGKLGSKVVATNALLLYSMLLITLGLANSITQLVLGLVFFGMAGNFANIAINTQAVGVEAKYGRNIMASFHGLWSLAGFTAAGIGAFTISRNILPFAHFLFIMSAIFLGMAVAFHFLLPDEKKKKVTAGGGRFFAKPDKALLVLGVIAFCCMICEGAMFDWSGIYFQKVVGAEKGWVGAGYTAFMCTMALGRFVADRVAVSIGFKKTVQFSGLLIAVGLGIAVVLPYLATAILGFLLVGFGVSSVVPLVYSEAGKSKKVTPSAALAVVSSIGFLGFLIGPPVIGVVAGLSSLKISFIIIALMGISVTFIASRFNRQHEAA
jgi:MFS family permease